VENKPKTSPFKAYDIRGVYDGDITADMVYRIGRELPSLLDAKVVLVGRDARISSPEVFEALCHGITDAGANVDDMGLCTTPMTYYFTGKKDYRAAVMITASHNPKEYNGLKISRRGALPVGGDSGLKELEWRIEESANPEQRSLLADHPDHGRIIGIALYPGWRATDTLPSFPPKGTVRSVNYTDEYIAFLRSQLPDISGLKFAIDCSNGVVAPIAKGVFGTQPFYLADTLDGTFPDHSPNPLEEEATRLLRDCVRKNNFDIGLIFDGDADRVMFIDETGRFIRPDLITALLAEHYLRKEPSARILCDIRTSRGVTETIMRLGGKPIIWKVGHAFAKVKLRETRAIVGGELAGHYYFRDFFCCDAAMLCAEIVLGVVAEAKRKGKTFSQLLAETDIYANTGECNYIIEKKEEALEAVKKWAKATQPKPIAEYDFDGIRYEWRDWWFNMRLSNTEPYLRLVCEAESETLLAEKKAAIEKVIRN